MKKRLGWVWIGLLLSSPAFAARAAQVDVEDAELRKGPGPKFLVLQKLPRGSFVAASNYPTEGYYKVRTTEGEVGWVAGDSLILQPLHPSAPGQPKDGK